jgi:hypothetical protein
VSDDDEGFRSAEDEEETTAPAPAPASASSSASASASASAATKSISADQARNLLQKLGAKVRAKAKFGLRERWEKAVGKADKKQLRATAQILKLRIKSVPEDELRKRLRTLNVTEDERTKKGAKEKEKKLSAYRQRRQAPAAV